MTLGPDGTTVSYVPVATTEAMPEAYDARRTGDEVAQGIGAFSAIQVARARLVDDWKIERYSWR